MADGPEPRPEDETARAGTTGLLNDSLSNGRNLLRGELDLFRAVVQENAKRAFLALVLLAAAVVILLVALNVLAAALTAGLAELGLAAGWSALIVGGALIAIAVIVAVKGKSDLERVSLAPTRTERNVRDDAEMIKETTDGR
ncbi:phage holin family protein [Palleronia sp.]|uniref:phage holin family protein n=1 Tax=Palleronia sp. TaxID=1940284 RepID=UPI0035C81057